MRHPTPLLFVSIRMPFSVVGASSLPLTLLVHEHDDLFREITNRYGLVICYDKQAKDIFPFACRGYLPTSKRWWSSIANCFRYNTGMSVIYYYWDWQSNIIIAIRLKDAGKHLATTILVWIIAFESLHLLSDFLNWLVPRILDTFNICLSCCCTPLDAQCEAKRCFMVELTVQTGPHEGLFPIIFWHGVWTSPSAVLWRMTSSPMIRIRRRSFIY